jgi:hypothetical protein
MNKKILIGSIIVITVLIGVSLTSVMGYRNIESILKDSPLFNIRTNRAIGKESQDFIRKYNSEGDILPFPKQDDRTILVQKLIDRIGNMDGETFERLIAYIINFARQNNRLNGINPDRIREALYLLRDNDEPISIFEDDTDTAISSYTTHCTINYRIKGILACILFFPLLPFIIFMILFWGAQTSPITILICPPQPPS